MSYNGWANWDTWNVELWLDNDEPMYRAKQRFIKRTERYLIDNLSVKEFVLDLMPQGTPDMQDESKPYADVDWCELAEHWQEEKDEYDAE